VESFGARLKKERQQRKITLDEIAASTKIGTRFLRALEEEHFEQLPGGIFNKGFVRAYARHLGIDEEQAIADYLAAAGAGQLEKKPEEAAQPVVWAEEASSGTARVPWGIFAIALLIVAFGFAIWGFHSRESRQQDRATPSPAANRAVPASAASPHRPDLKQSKATESAAQVVPPSEQSVRPASGAPPAASPEPRTAASPASPAQTPVAAPGAFLVLVKAHGDSWLTITADGKEIMRALLAASKEKSVEARKEIVIKAGSVGALDFSFNGKRLPAQGGYDEVKTLTFDGNGLQPAVAKAQSAAEPSQQ
jgi:cytoskeleton protein RodZ